MMYRKAVIVMLSIVLILSLAGCLHLASESHSAGFNHKKGSSPADLIILKLAMWDADSAFLDSWTQKVNEFSQVMPNVKIEVETFKGDSDYLQEMKVRLAANELPDMIELKPNFINEFREELLPLDGLSVTAKNKKAQDYAVDGKVLALPVISFPELVYYHPSIFQELGLHVPKTWSEFIQVLSAIKASGKYQPYAMGGKDAWTNYPFNEFMPLLESGDENYYDHMARMDHPFAQDTPFYKAYRKIQALYDAKVMSNDPLRLSNDQATGMFESKKAAIIAAGLWYLPQYQTKVGNIDDLAAFPLPIRDTVDEPLRVMTFTDNFFGINNKSKKIEVAKQFLEWLFSSDAYLFYVNKKQANSVMEGVIADVPFLHAFYRSNTFEEFNYRPGGESYNHYMNSIQLDWKKIGQEMMGGKSIDKIAKELNAKWAQARASQ